MKRELKSFLMTTRMMVDLKRIGVVVKHTTFGGLKCNLLTHVVNGFSDCETSTVEVIPLFSNLEIWYRRSGH